MAKKKKEHSFSRNGSESTAISNALSGLSSSQRAILYAGPRGYEKAFKKLQDDITVDLSRKRIESHVRDQRYYGMLHENGDYKPAPVKRRQNGKA